VGGSRRRSSADRTWRLAEQAIAKTPDPAVCLRRSIRPDHLASNPEAYIVAVLDRLAQGHPASRLHELLPWNFSADRQAAAQR
jgi:hypothetical protein